MFDYDGVIADSYDAFLGELARTCAAFGLEDHATREACLELFDTNLYEGLDRAGLAAEQRPRFLAELARRVGPREADVAFFPGAVNALETLARDHVVVVITSNVGSVVSRSLQNHGVRSVRAVSGAEDGPDKVSRIRGAMDAYDARPVYYVGDTVGDVKEARLAGARAVAVTWGWHPEPRLRRANPEHMVQSYDELLALLDHSSS